MIDAQSARDAWGRREAAPHRWQERWRRTHTPSPSLHARQATGATPRASACAPPSSSRTSPASAWTPPPRAAPCQRSGPTPSASLRAPVRRGGAGRGERSQLRLLHCRRLAPCTAIACGPGGRGCPLSSPRAGISPTHSPPPYLCACLPATPACPPSEDAKRDQEKLEEALKEKAAPLDPSVAHCGERRLSLPPPLPGDQVQPLPSLPGPRFLC